MDLMKLLDEYKNGRRVAERAAFGGTTGRQGTIFGSGLGGAATGRRGNRFVLTVRVKWDDGKEDLNFHWGLAPV